MPIGIHRCDCGNVFETPPERVDYQYAKCECGKLANRIPPGAPALINFKEGWYEHIAADPIYCKNKGELRRACKDHGKTSIYLEDM